MGLLCPTMPEAYGGYGVDRLYSMILIEEQAYAMDSSTGFSLHSDIVANYLHKFGNEEQKEKYLALLASGEKLGAFAITEPGAGSDPGGMNIKAERKGELSFMPTDSTRGSMAFFRVQGDLETGITYYKVPVQYLASKGTFENGEKLIVDFRGYGDVGATGPTGPSGPSGPPGPTGPTGERPGIVYYFDADVSDTDPGEGNIRFDKVPPYSGSTLIFIDTLLNVWLIFFRTSIPCALSPSSTLSNVFSDMPIFLANGSECILICCILIISTISPISLAFKSRVYSSIFFI